MELFQALTLLLLAPCAVLLALPAACDLWAWLRSRWRHARRPSARAGEARLLFLVPAHNEAQLIRRCVASLLNQTYPKDRLEVVVLADNCDDRTAVLARERGATVLERASSLRGKHHAIAWAIERLPLDSFDALVIIDADTVVDSSFALELSRCGPLRGAVVHCYNDASNEFENWFTRLAVLLTRNRYDIALPLKVAAGLNCPITGNGAVLGTDVLKRHPWRIETITEGWELYARFTLLGLRMDYAPQARLYAQETRSFRQSGTQRERWTAGRIAVLRRYGARILTRRGLGLLQRLDLLAELSSLGPAMRAFLGVVGIGVTWIVQPPYTAIIIALFASTVLQPALYTAISLARHPQPMATVLALLRLPGYVAWRVWVGLRSLLVSGTGAWVRTQRHEERAAS